jgi:hypothetical protein
MALIMSRTFTLELVLLTILSTGLISAQEVYLLVQGGRSSYSSLYFGNLGGGGGDQHWKPGPILGVGVRLKTSGSFSVDGTVEYSSHPFYPDTWSYPVKGDPRNKIFDLNAVARASFTLLRPVSGSFSFGAGYWHQTKDPIEYDSPYPGVPKGHTASGLGLVLGLGLAVELTDRFDVYLDGNLRGREYVTPVLQLGLAYRIH